MVTRKTRLMSGLVAILMVVSLFTAFVLPATAGSYYDEVVSATGLKDVSALPNIKDYPANGATEFKVTDRAGMDKIAELALTGVNFSGKTIYQANDIDMSGERFFEGIGALVADGNHSYGFQGTFDGNGFVFDNLFVVRTDGAAGLFTYARAATFKNIGIASGVVIGNDRAGGIVGDSTGGIKLINCWNAATVVGGGENGTAGLAGKANDASKFYNCYNLGMVYNANTPFASSMAGWINNNGFQMANCYGAGQLVTGFKGLTGTDGYYAMVRAAANADRGNNVNNYYRKGFGMLMSLAEAKVDNTAIVATDGAAGVDASDLADGKLVEKLNGTSDATAVGTVGAVSGYTVSFTQSTAGYPVITYSDAEGNPVVKRVAHDAVNLLGENTWGAENEIWNKIYNQAGGGLTDASNGVIEINTANDLYVLSMLLIGATNTTLNITGIRLNADIDMKDVSLSGIPAGAVNIPLCTNYEMTCNFEGNGHIIKNWTTDGLRARWDTNSACGLISGANGGMTITNLGLVNASATQLGVETAGNSGYAYPALLIDRAYNVTMDNCFAIGTIVARNDNGVDYNNIAGLIGRCWPSNNTLKVTNSWSDTTAVKADGTTYKARNIGSMNTATLGEDDVLSNIWYSADVSPWGNDNNANSILNGLNARVDAYADDGTLAYFLNSKLDQKWTVVDGYTTWGTAENATYKATVQKRLADGTVWSVSDAYINAGAEIPAYEGYTFNAESSSVLADGKMPQADVTLVYDLTGLNFGPAEAIVAQYEGYDITLFAEENQKAKATALAALAYQGQELSEEDEAAATALIAEAVQWNTVKAPLTLSLTYPNYPKYSELALYESINPNKEWAIATKEDWLAAVKTGANAFTGVTLHLVNDIDMENTNMMPLSYGKAFDGTLNGHGHVFKNIRIEMTMGGTAVGLISAVGTGTVEKLGIESGLINVVYTSTGDGVGIGAFAGYSISGSKFINCWNGADVMVTIGATHHTGYSVTGLVGRGYAGTIIDGCYNIGRISGDAHAAALNDWGQTGAMTYNSFNAGLITAQNDKRTGVMRYNAGSDVSALISNVYTMNSNYLVSEAHATTVANFNNDNYILKADAYSTGELAWKLNSGYDPAKGQRTYYTLQDGKTVFGTAENQTVRIAMVCGENTKYVYANAGTTIALSYTLGAATYALAEGSAGTLVGNNLTVPASDVTVNVTLTGTDYTALEDAIAAAEAKNASLFKTAEGVSLDTFIAGVKEKIAAGTADVADAAVIATATYKAGALPAAHEAAANPDATGYKIYDLADMEYVALHSSLFTADKTLYFESDIEVEPASPANSWWYVKAGIDGQNHTVSGVTKQHAWMSSNAFVKNITFSDFTIMNNGNSGGIIMDVLGTGTVLVENVKLLNSTNTHAFSNGKNNAADNGIGGFIGKVNGDAVINFKNVLLEGVTVNYNLNISNKGNVGLLIGPANANMSVENVILRNNTINASSCGWAVSYLAAEMTVGTYNVKNVGIFGNTLTSNNLNGVLTTEVKGGAVLTADNIIVAGNTSEGTAFATISSSGTVSNLFTTGEATAAIPATTVTTAETKSGKAAYLANAAIAGTDAATWVMDPAQEYPVFGSAGLPFEITFVASDGDESTADVVTKMYTNTAGTIIGITKDFIESANWDYKGNLGTDTFAANTTINGTSIPAHNHVWGNYTHVEGGDTHISECTWSQGGIECPATKVENCVFDKSPVPVDPSVDISQAQHTATCVCGNTGEAVACTFGDPIATQAPTCAVNGYEKYMCTGCGTTYTVVLAAIGHDWSGWTHVDGTKGDASRHTRTCANNAAEVETENCVYGEWRVVTPASRTVEGLKARTCEVCGHEDTAVIPKVAYLTVESLPGVIGEELEVDVVLNNNPGVAGMIFEVEYDADALTLKRVESGDWDILVSDGPVSGDSGMVTAKVSFANASDITGDGVALKLIFDVKLGATSGEHNINVTAVDVSNANGDLFAFEACADVITISSAVKGDVNKDRLVTIADAVLLLRLVGGDTTLDTTALNTELAATDINGDGTRNTADIVYLLQYLNGWYESL